MRKNTLYLVAIAMVIFLLSCGNANNEKNSENRDVEAPKTEQIKEETEAPNNFKDKRDGKTYEIVKIGDQIWFAENLAFKPTEGNFWVYDNKEENVEKYGYLYDFKTAQNVAPEGWHLPSKEEFETLVNHFGEELFNSLTTDKNGLNIIYSGWFYDESGFTREGTEVGFWSSTKEDDKNAWLLIVDGQFKHVFIRSRFMLGTGAAVRLIKD